MRRGRGAGAEGERIPGAVVRRLTDRDIDAAIRLTDLEHWGYTRADWGRLLGLAPEGCFAAEADGEVVGVLSTTPYGPVAFLGAVIVRPDHRGKGVGGAMMRAALDHLDRSGVSTVRLNAYLDVVPFYEKLGFRREYGNTRWHGALVGAARRGVRSAWTEDLDAVIALDADHVGVTRTALLTRLLQEFSASFLVAEARGRIRGFAVGNASGGACEIGPWIAEPGDRSVARDLAMGLARVTHAATYAYSAPEPNREALAFAQEHGFREAFRTVRMARGPGGHDGRPEGVYGFAGLEKG